MAFGDEDMYRDLPHEITERKTRQANIERWNRAAEGLVTLVNVLNFEETYEVQLFTPEIRDVLDSTLNAEANEETVNYLSNYPMRFGVSDRRTIATEGLFARILEGVQSVGQPTDAVTA